MVKFSPAFATISDQQLYKLCQKYGERARTWRQKFAGLLPEVHRRKLYEKKGFGSIFEFAAKLAGMSQDQVKRVLSLDEHFEQMPILKKMLEEGEVSINKLARIGSVVTAENQEFWAAQAKLLPKGALETLVRDERRAQNQNDLFEPQTKADFVPGHKIQSEKQTEISQTSNLAELQLSSEVQQKLLNLQNKGIDINTLLLELLEKRDQEIAQKKNQLAAAQKTGTSNRYISVEIKKILQAEYGTKCSVPGCNKPAANLHHKQRYGLTQNHDPHFLAPLCEEHHRIAHSIDVTLQEIRTRKIWTG